MHVHTQAEIQTDSNISLKVYIRKTGYEWAAVV